MVKEWKTFGLKRRSSFMPTACPLCLIIIQHDVNSVWHWSVSERLASFKTPQARTPRTRRFRVCISNSTVSCPCSFSYHKTNILEPASAISWLCHLHAQPCHCYRALSGGLLQPLSSCLCDSLETRFCQFYPKKLTPWVSMFSQGRGGWISFSSLSGKIRSIFFSSQNY